MLNGYAGDLEYYDLILKDQENQSPITINTKYVKPAVHVHTQLTQYQYLVSKLFKGRITQSTG